MALPEFLYLLMRDHLPTGVVKEVIDQTPGPGAVPSAPELMALAERYAADLAELDDPVPSAEVPAAAALPPGPTTPQLPRSGTARLAIVTAMRQHGGSMKFAEIVEATGRKGGTIRQALQYLVRDGLVVAAGATQGRRYWLPRGQDEETSDGGVEGRDQAEPVKGAAADDESAGLKDPPVDATPGDASGENAEQPLGVGKLHLKDKEPENEGSEVGAELMAQATDWAEGQRTFKRRHLAAVFPALTASQLRTITVSLVERGVVELKGDLYEVMKANGQSPTGDAGTVEGHVMQLIQDSGGATVDGLIASRVDANEDQIRAILDKLFRESMVRPVSKQGHLVYELV